MIKHLKNWNLDGSWELTPAYDITHAYNPDGEWTYQHLMAVNGKIAGITRNDLLAVAERFGIGTAEKVLKHVGESVSRWPDFAAHAALDTFEINRIFDHHNIL